MRLLFLLLVASSTLLTLISASSQYPLPICDQFCGNETAVEECCQRNNAYVGTCRHGLFPNKAVCVGP